jgi:hypothetical protein
MKFARGIPKKYRRSVEDAFDAILEFGNEMHRRIADEILESKMLVRVEPVAKINASGVTGVIDPDSTNEKIKDERIGIREALGEIYISIAEETIDTGGQRGCEGTFVHEGRHAYDFAQTIESLSNADLNPLSIFDPTLYELEFEAHRVSGEYMLRVGREEYIDEGIQLLILAKNVDGGCFLDEDGICQRLRNNYGLAIDSDQGRTASELLGLKQK